ncbi:hypothetical protein [Exiguobacterium acetylicum]|uniref:hypothetical protein n=1 Tax=Exiguobacterium acetylicum TaxID=41170 RepID=UPI000494A890|nr:hypothetical protein [Exiguobacterium acetylicum]
MPRINKKYCVPSSTSRPIRQAFINYLEVVITADGKIHYSVPSHQQFLLNRLMKERNLTHKELDDCARRSVTSTITAGSHKNTKRCSSSTTGSRVTQTNEQLDAIQMLRDEELLHTVVPPKTIKYLYREQYQKVMAHMTR